MEWVIPAQALQTLLKRDNMETTEHTIEDYKLALKLIIEQKLLSDGATKEGVKKYTPQLVEKYLNMATGKEPTFYNSIHAVD